MEYTHSFFTRTSEKISFGLHTTIVETSGGLTITFPNQWFFIACYFVDFLKALKEYKQYFNEIFNGLVDLQRITREIKEGGSIPTIINSKIEEYFPEENDVKYFKKFISDYDWWFGSKTIDRGDYFVSPILRLAKVVNVTQSYIADLAYKLTEKPELITFLKRSSVSLKIPKEEKKITVEKFDVNIFQELVSAAGLKYDPILLGRLIASLLTKPFVILTGLSGSGKTKLAQAFVQWICQNESQYKIVPVGSDWTNREPLLGFPNALNPKEYVKPDSGVLDLIIKANDQPELPHFLILDEMNLSQVERYFADFLSVMESGEEIPLFAEGTVENGLEPKLKLPSNLFVIGTVNIDETTNMFSPKVLDRANTIEFRVMKDEMESFLENMREIKMDVLVSKGAGMARDFLRLASNRSIETKDIDEIRKTLLKFFVELKKTGAEFGYRSASEILRLIHQLSVLDESLSIDAKLDIAIMQKLLPKLHGSRRKLVDVLITLASFCVDENKKIERKDFEKGNLNAKDLKINYPLSFEKIQRMYKGAVENGYSSFAEA